ncbi:MAG: hypothetical protein HYX53_06670 [Chloroflexi bacterium]|nr:hypothetical protein [Chloroflexota bacterium]
MAPVLAFWGASLLIGALALPIAFVLLRRLPDAGAGLSSPLGLVVAGYAYFILRTMSVLPQGRGGYLLAVGLLAVISAAVAGRDRRFRVTLGRAAPAAVAVAGLFTLGFFAFVAYRSYVPDIAGTEEPMDFMYLNATLTSPGYPPQDPWLAGKPASYYYFGYLQIGLLTRTAGVEPEQGYNLGLAYTFAAAAAGIGSIAFAFGRWALGARGRRWAAAGAGVAVLLLLGIGSLSAIFEVAAAHGRYNEPLFRFFGVDWLQPCRAGVTEGCRAVARTTAWYPTEFWFWWRGSRIIPNTITEFPFFSFLLGDLHPHVMALPLVLLAIGLSAHVWRGRSLLSYRDHLRRPWIGLGLGVILGALAFQNAWDVLTFAGILAVAVFVRDLRRKPALAAIGHAATYLLPIAAVAFFAYLPWYRDFKSQQQGIRPYVGAGTIPAHAFLQFGPLLLTAALALTFAFRRARSGDVANAAFASLWLPLVPMLGWMAFAGARGELGGAIDARGDLGWVTLAVYGLMVAALFTSFLVLARARDPVAIVPALAAVGALLLYGSELFYIKDIFGGQPRLNTVFKLTYQAWVLLSLAGGVAIVLALRAAVKRRQYAGWLGAPVALVVLGGLVYPVTSIPNRTAGRTVPTTIDGLDFLARNDPGEYALTRWVRDHTDPGDVIIEGSGRTWTRGPNGEPVVSNAGSDYTESARISARTGRATPIGWFFHEVQWRGNDASVTAELERRQNLVDRAYIATTPAAVLQAMRDAGATYLVVGTIERSRFAGLMPRFDTFLDTAFQDGDTRIYRMPVFEVVPTS